MKKLTLFLLILGGMILFNACGEKTIKEGFTYEPAKPRPGDEVTIYYKPTDPRFMDADSLVCNYYLAKGDYPIAFSKQLEKKEDYFTTVVETDKETRLVYLHVLNMELDYSERNDNNDSSGYQIILYDNNGSQVAGTLAEMGKLKSTWDNLMFTDINYEKAFALFVEEFEKNPEIKEEYVLNYLFLASQYKGVNGDSLIEKELSVIVSKDFFTKAEYKAINRFYEKDDRDAIVDKISNYFREHHPKSDVIKEIEENEIASLPDIDEKLARYAAFVEKYPESSSFVLNYTIINQLKSETNDERVVSFIDTFQNNIDDQNFYYLTWDLIQKGKLELANKYITLAIENVEKSLTDFSKKPSYYTIELWKSSQKYNLGKYLARKGHILSKLGEDDEAVALLKKAVEYTHSSNIHFNVLYVELLIKTEQYETAIEKVKEFCVAGKKSDKLIDLLGEAYIKVHGSDEGLIELTEDLTLTAKQKLQQELEQEWLDIPAPSFTLKDLDGNEVSLSDYKGKIVVLDFWATWCGPCRASFPGLQKAVDLYGDDENVVFLFINAWEKVENPVEYVSQFIDEKGYTFRVLLDVENTVIEQYNVTGIPRKYVIDTDGIIRFKSVGYEGSDEQVVKHVQAMIEMVKEKS